MTVSDSLWTPVVPSIPRWPGDNTDVWTTRRDGVTLQLVSCEAPNSYRLDVRDRAGQTIMQGHGRIYAEWFAQTDRGRQWCIDMMSWVDRDFPEVTDGE